MIDNHRAEAPARPEDGYHLSEDLVDQLLLMISDSKGIRPDRPFLAYLPFGATHAPHQAPPDYLAKYRGRYDEGWDVVRERWYRRQLELGVIPQGTRLAPRNPGVEPWDTLPGSHQVFAARLQEAFAAFLDHTDDQIGRLVGGLERLGQLDNTILIVLSDNGASQEGGPFGVMHEMKWFNGIPEVPEEAIARLDEIGGPRSYVNYPWGWAQCGNSPFKWYKQNTHEGGVHVPLVVHWPEGIAAAERGTMRRSEQERKTHRRSVTGVHLPVHVLRIRTGRGGRWLPAPALAGRLRLGAWGRRSWTWGASCFPRRPPPAARPPTTGTSRSRCGPRRRSD